MAAKDPQEIAVSERGRISRSLAKPSISPLHFVPHPLDCTPLLDPAHEVAGIIAAVEKLADEPFPQGSEKLSGSDHSHRIRLGDYRVVYEVFRE